MMHDAVCLTLRLRWPHLTGWPAAACWLADMLRGHPLTFQLHHPQGWVIQEDAFTPEECAMFREAMDRLDEREYCPGVRLPACHRAAKQTRPCCWLPRRWVHDCLAERILGPFLGDFTHKLRAPISRTITTVVTSPTLTT